MLRCGRNVIFELTCLYIITTGSMLVSPRNCCFHYHLYVWLLYNISVGCQLWKSTKRTHLSLAVILSLFLTLHKDHVLNNQLSFKTKMKDWTVHILLWHFYMFPYNSWWHSLYIQTVNTWEFYEVFSLGVNAGKKD